MYRIAEVEKVCILESGFNKYVEFNPAEVDQGNLLYGNYEGIEIGLNPFKAYYQDGVLMLRLNGRLIKSDMHKKRYLIGNCKKIDLSKFDNITPQGLIIAGDNPKYYYNSYLKIFYIPQDLKLVEEFTIISFCVMHNENK